MTDAGKDNGGRPKLRLIIGGLTNKVKDKDKSESNVIDIGPYLDPKALHPKNRRVLRETSAVVTEFPKK
jgi:hypothetical protein